MVTEVGILHYYTADSCFLRYILEDSWRLISYRIYNGTETMSWLKISGLGVMTPATIRIMTMVCFRYFFRIFGLMIPIRVNTTTTIGNSKMSPISKVMVVTDPT